MANPNMLSRTWWFKGPFRMRSRIWPGAGSSLHSGFAVETFSIGPVGPTDMDSGLGEDSLRFPFRSPEELGSGLRKVVNQDGKFRGRLC